VLKAGFALEGLNAYRLNLFLKTLLTRRIKSSPLLRTYDYLIIKKITVDVKEEYTDK
jgi:hypothetical protein